MNRRSVLASFFGGTAAIAIGTRAAADDGLPDELHADSYRQYFASDEEAEVTLDGAVVSSMCVAANRAESWADVYVRDYSRVERRRGVVTFRRVSVSTKSA